MFTDLYAGGTTLIGGRGKRRNIRPARFGAPRVEHVSSPHDRGRMDQLRVHRLVRAGRVIQRRVFPQRCGRLGQRLERLRHGHAEEFAIPHGVAKQLFGQPVAVHALQHVDVVGRRALPPGPVAEEKDALEETGKSRVAGLQPSLGLGKTAEPSGGQSQPAQRAGDPVVEVADVVDVLRQRSKLQDGPVLEIGHVLHEVENPQFFLVAELSAICSYWAGIAINLYAGS